MTAPRMAVPFLTKAIGLVVVVSVAGGLVANELAGGAVQAAIAELGATRLGVPWNRREDEPARSIAARVASGVAIGLASAALLFAVARATGSRRPFAPTLAPVTFLVTLLAASLASMRDELLVRGLVARLLAPARPAWTVAASGVASMAWSLGRAGATGVSLAELAAAGLAGALFGALWVRDRAAWMPIAAHATFSVATGGGELGLSAGWASPVALCAACACVSARVLRRSRENSASFGVLG